MGGSLTELDSPPDDAPKTFTEIFEEQFPYYLSLGMSNSEYWDGDNDLPSLYREAQEIKRKRANQAAWLQGYYHYLALGAALSGFSNRPIPYLEEPLPLTQEEADERQRLRYEQKTMELRRQLMEEANANG